jgi:hypothetical protein
MSRPRLRRHRHLPGACAQHTFPAGSDRILFCERVIVPAALSLVIHTRIIFGSPCGESQSRTTMSTSRLAAHPSLRLCRRQHRSSHTTTLVRSWCLMSVRQRKRSSTTMSTRNSARAKNAVNGPMGLAHTTSKGQLSAHLCLHGAGTDSGLRLRRGTMQNSCELHFHGDDRRPVPCQLTHCSVADRQTPRYPVLRTA